MKNTQTTQPQIDMTDLSQSTVAQLLGLPPTEVIITVFRDDPVEQESSFLELCFGVQLQRLSNSRDLDWDQLPYRVNNHQGKK